MAPNKTKQRTGSVCPNCGGRLRKVGNAVAEGYALYECIDKGKYVPEGKVREKDCAFYDFQKEAQ